LASASERDLPRLVVSVQALAVAACAAAAAGAGPGEDPIDAVCRDLAEHPEQRFDLRGWCRARSLDYDRFRKDFVRRLGVPPHRFRIRRRLDRACALLRAGAGVAEVAAQLGYPSPFEFSAQFRAHLGVPPSRWRA
jgi:AraC-like DNA-binding protein